MNLHENLNALGNSAQANRELYEKSHEDGAILLERFPAPTSVPHLNRNGASLSLDITTNEFTSLCPMTGQPDFATIIIEYIPDEWCVESKSLKLYFGSYRNRGDFHESCIVAICNDLIDVLNPRYIKVQGQFTPRGGIPFWPTCTWERDAC